MILYYEPRQKRLRIAFIRINNNNVDNPVMKWEEIHHIEYGNYQLAIWLDVAEQNRTRISHTM